MAMVNWTEFCKNCGECCGIFPFEEALFERYQHLAQKGYFLMPNVEGWSVPLTDDGYCVFLTSDKRCAIYANRPEICRLYGIIPELQCTKLKGEKTDLLGEYFSIKDIKNKYGKD